MECIDPYYDYDDVDDEWAIPPILLALILNNLLFPLLCQCVNWKGFGLFSFLVRSFCENVPSACVGSGACAFQINKLIK